MGVEGGTGGGGKTGVKKKLKRTQPLTVKKRERASKKTQWSKKHATVFLSVGEHVPESVAEPTVTPVTGVGDGGSRGASGRALPLLLLARVESRKCIFTTTCELRAKSHSRLCNS